MLTSKKAEKIRARGIDFSDIPEWTEEMWKSGQFKNPQKSKEAQPKEILPPLSKNQIEKIKSEFAQNVFA